MSAPLLGAHHPEVLRLRRLVRQASARAREGAFVVEGRTNVLAALGAGAVVEAVYLPPPVDAEDRDERLARVVAAAAAGGVPVRRVDREVLGRAADAVTSQAVLAVCRSVVLPVTVESIRALPVGGLLLVGVEIGDPGNAGTMIRSADANGSAGVVFAGHSVDVTNPKVVRSAAGSLFHLPVLSGGHAAGIGAAGIGAAGIGAARIGAAGVGAAGVGAAGSGAAGSATLSPVELVRALQAAGWRCLGAVADGGEPCDRADLRGPVALLVGNEARGLPSGLALDGQVHIPMSGRSESLNVAMAATILGYEAARQRRSAADA